MEQWLQIRQRVLREGVSKRRILKETGMHWTTLEKILNNSSPPGYQRTKSPKKTKIGPYLNRIREILEQDKTTPKRQRHTAHRIWQRLQTEGFTGGYTIVKDAVREIKKTSKEVFMPLKHPPDEAQVDFGQAVLETLSRIQMLDVSIPTLNGRTLRMQRAISFELGLVLGLWDLEFICIFQAGRLIFLQIEVLYG